LPPKKILLLLPEALWDQGLQSPGVQGRNDQEIDPELLNSSSLPFSPAAPVSDEDPGAAPIPLKLKENFKRILC
jgi:hypothetical protein